jgi:uncharacterized protein YndB with AHSA1/START domain
MRLEEEHMRSAYSIEIDRPADEVWPVITEVEQIKRWVPDLVSDVATNEGPTRAGTTSRMSMREGSKVVVYDSVITRYEPGRRLSLELSGGSLGRKPMLVDYVLTRAGARTRVDFTSEWTPSGWLWLMLPLILIVGAANAKRALKAMKAVAEGKGRRDGEAGAG